MDFEEYSKTKEGLIELGDKIKEDIRVSILYWLSIRKQITIEVIGWSFDRADKVVRDLKDAELEARIRAIEEKTSESDILSVLLAIFIPSIVGRGISAWFRQVLVQKNGKGAKILKAIDNFLLKRTGGTPGRPGVTMTYKEGVFYSNNGILPSSDLSSKQILEDGGKGAIAALYKAIRQERSVNIQVKSKRDDLIQSSATLAGEETKSKVSPARGFQKVIQNTLFATNFEWENLALLIAENELNSPFHMGPQYEDLELVGSKDDQRETHRSELRDQQIQYLFKTLSFLEDQQQQFYQLIYQEAKLELTGEKVRYIPRTSNYYKIVQLAQARGGPVEPSLLEELGHEFQGNPDEVWVIGEKIEPLARGKRELLTDWYEDLYIGLLLATYFDLSEGPVFAHIDGHTIIPLQKHISRRRFGDHEIKETTFRDKKNRSHKPSYVHKKGSYLPYLGKLTGSTLLKVANILVYQDDQMVKDYSIKRGEKVIEAASSPMASVSKAPPKPGVNLPGFWGPSNLPDEDSLETLRFFIDLALLQYAETLKTSKSIVAKAEEELRATIK